MRLIDADALGIGRANPDVFEEKAYAWGWNTAIDVIEAAPTIDAVPVVRCKDCAWRGTPECGMYYVCECGQQHTWETDNDYCSFGKRKEKTNE